MPISPSEIIRDPDKRKGFSICGGWNSSGEEMHLQLSLYIFKPKLEAQRGVTTSKRRYHEECGWGNPSKNILYNILEFSNIRGIRTRHPRIFNDTQHMSYSNILSNILSKKKLRNRENRFLKNMFSNTFGGDGRHVADP